MGHISVNKVCNNFYVDCNYRKFLYQKEKMKKLILLLFIPLVSFSQTPIRYYEDGDDSLVGIIVFIALLIIFYFYNKNSDKKKWKN